MKTYLGIIAILTAIFIQVNKNYKNNDIRGPIHFIENDTSTWNVINGSGFRLFYTKQDSNICPEIIKYINAGMLNASEFFSARWLQDFDVYIYPNRDAMDKQWQTDWNMPKFKSRCWMVASGTATRLDLLSPQVWNKEACEHSFENKLKLERLIHHELVHVYQGQYSPNPNFDGMDNIGWFVEGLAVYVSGQLDEERINRAKKALEKDKIPDELSEIWSGRFRYATAGTLVQYIDQKYGRKKMVEMLKFTTEEQILEFLLIGHDDLLREWKTYLATL